MFVCEYIYNLPGKVNYVENASEAYKGHVNIKV